MFKKLKETKDYILFYDTVNCLPFGQAYEGFYYDIELDHTSISYYGEIQDLEKFGKKLIKEWKKFKGLK